MAQRDAWLVVLRADALEDWLKANHPGIQRKGPKGYKSLCNSDTSLVAYLRWCTHGVEIGAVHRAFVVSAATGTEAALKGLKEFNAATAKMYQPLHSMAIERVLPGPVYMAEIYDRETSAVEYEPFTPASKDEMLREVQERASQYGEGFDLKVAAFNRAPATLGRRFIEGTKENIDFARSNVDMAAAAEEDVRDQMDEVSGMAAGPGFAVGLPQNMWSPTMLKAYAKGDENAFDQAYLEFKSRARAELQSDQVRKSMLPELSKAAMQRKLTGNPYKAVIPIVSGIAYVENPIPELVKGSSTPYLRYTRDWEFLAPQSRDRDFEQQVEQQTGASRSSVRVFRALGSGKHWVGVALWQIEEMEDYTEHLLVVTLQSGKSWSVAENKVLRWFSTPSDKPGQHDETGAGGVDFLRWALEYVKQTIAFLKEILERSKGQYAPKPYRIVVGWADPKRERAYAWLTRLGFRKVADGGNGSPAYILDIEKQAKKNPSAYVANPKKVPDVPIEAAVRSERIGTKTRELTPGVHAVAQISSTGKEVWLTHGEQRLFLYLQDDQGRGSLFYQSFAGTGGKAQGYWFPSGGILADQRGRGVWVIKGNPKTDPGAGREGLLALYEKANAVLPQSDAETDAFVKKATRLDYDDLMYKDEYEIKPTMKILEEGHANALQSKWATWAYRFWALNALDKTWGKRTFNIKENPRDLAGRHVPDRYLAGLPTALRKQRIGELTQSRDDYKLGDYSELPTDRIARKMGLVKQSQYTTEAKKRGIEYRGDLRDMAKRVMVFYGHRASAREVSAFAEALRKSFSKGLAAWKSGGHRPGATAQNWAVARVNSLVVGGKTSWTADKKLFEVLPAAVRAKIESMRAMRSNPLDPKDDRDLLGWLGEKVLLDVARASRGAVSRGSRLYGGRESKEAQQEMFQAAAAAALQYLQKKYDAPALRRFMELDEKEEYGRTASQEREYSYMNQEFESAVSRAVAAGKSTIPKQRAEERLGRVVDEESRERMATFFRKQQAAIAILKEFKPLGYVPTEQQIANVLYPKLSYSAPQKALHEYRKLLVNLRLPVYEPLEQASEKTSKRSSVLEISRDVDRTLAQSEITPVQPFAAFEAAEEEEERRKDAEVAMAALREMISKTPPGAEREILVALRAVVPPRGPDNLLVAVQNRSGASLSEVRGVVGKYLATVQTAIEERKQLQLEAAQSKAKSPRLLLKNNRRR